MDPPSGTTPARPTDAERPRIVLALSGGGARCFAQIGALEALLDAGVEPVAASASSSAAFLAALWAAGHPPARIYDLLMEASLAWPFDVDLERGLLGHGGIERVLAPYLPDRFEGLERPLAVVAIDADRGERFVLDSGPLLPALAASNAFPGLFAPVHLCGRVLVDGGGVEMVPVRTAQERWSAPVLAVDVGPPRSLDVPFEALPLPLHRLVAAAVRSVALGWKSYVVTQTELVDYQLRVHPPRWILRPELPADAGLFRFDLASVVVDAGRTSALRLLPDVTRERPA